MQEIYTMIVNNGVTLVIVVIFLYQYIVNLKKPDAKETSEQSKNRDLVMENYMLTIINKLDEIINLLENLLK